jgi:cell division protein FtsW (lipid II flippase)
MGQVLSPKPEAVTTMSEQVITNPLDAAAPEPDSGLRNSDFGLGNYFRRFPWGVVIPALMLTGMGLYAIHAAKPEYARKQLVWLGASLVAFLAVSLPHYRRLANWAYPCFGVCLVLLVIVLKSRPRGGAHRWIDLGPACLQPSELAKLAFIIALAEYLRFRENYRQFVGLAVPFLIALLPMGLIVIEPDLGTSLLFLPTLFAMLFAAGARRKHLIGIILMGVAAMPMFWMVMRDYQRMRVAVLMRQVPDAVRAPVRTALGLPEDHMLFGSASADRRFRSNEGHQLMMSLETIAAGGVAGDEEEDDPTKPAPPKLPENHTDFVFAMWARETGFVGGVALIATFLAMTWFGLSVGMSTPDPFGRLIAIGVAAMLAVQTIVNVGMTVGLMPITGITLPFLSYGGSSLVFSYAALGLLVNVSRRRPFLLTRRAFEFREE